MSAVFLTFYCKMMFKLKSRRTLSIVCAIKSRNSPVLCLVTIFWRRQYCLHQGKQGRRRLSRISGRCANFLLGTGPAPKKRRRREFEYFAGKVNILTVQLISVRPIFRKHSKFFTACLPTVSFPHGPDHNVDFGSPGVMLAFAYLLFTCLPAILVNFLPTN